MTPDPAEQSNESEVTPPLLFVDGPNASDCAAAGAVDMAYDFYDENDDYIGTDIFPCGSYAGTSAALPLGALSVYIVPIDDDELAVLDAEFIAFSVDHGNHFVDLGNVVFDVAP